MDRMTVEELFELLGRKEAEIWKLRELIANLEKALQVANAKKESTQ
jgi:hypothetical protein